MFTTFERQAGLLRQRREWLRCGGGLAVAAMGWPSALLGRTTPLHQPTSVSVRKARSCILIYLLGGPPHLDMFDLKPDAAKEVRGPFSPIATNVPGVQICELLPQLARITDKYALIRSVSHPNSNHTPMIYYTLTGRPTAQPLLDNDIRPPQRSDFPHLGSVLAKFKPAATSLPGYIALPELAIRSSTKGEFKRARSPLRGGGAGFLGPKFDPLSVNGEPGTREAIPALALPDGVSADRLESRATLLSLLDHPARSSAARAMHDVQQQAVLLTGAANRGTLPAFSLDDEAAEVRDRYGRHRFGQTMLLARRLAEAGVPMIAIHFNEMTVCDGWDTHSKNFDALKSELLPMVDQSLSALLEDLDQRGRLEETLVVCLGEFGRTPKINSNAGRDHWGDCGSALLAGGGIRGGQVLGASDSIGAYPVSDKVDPVDIHATLYHCLGLEPDLKIHDELQRPWDICTGQVLSRLLRSSS
jgi:hypothetical protein